MTQNGLVTTFPADAWYAVAHTQDVGRRPVGRIVHDRGIVLYRRLDGIVVALADRCLHSPYPLSLGRVEGDHLVSGYSGYVYGPDGAVVSVPTQTAVPIDAAVRRYPSMEREGLVWVWTGSAGLAGRHPLPRMPWLTSPDWSTFGSDWVTDAGAGLLQDNFADITHVAHLDPTLSPLALNTPPALNVEISEQQVRFWRDFPASPLQEWQYAAMDLPPETPFAQREEGLMASPGLWMDRWDVKTRERTLTMRFTHAITPVDDRRTQHFWAVSRNFALNETATGTLHQMFDRYYRSVKEALEVMQTVVDREGIAHEAGIRSDAARLGARRVMRRLVAEEAGR
jgi:phenylpropionate dioxygenase-like ring-hydroxylating dioxygenase large terminal subunit